jgi:hypothetical protein
LSDFQRSLWVITVQLTASNKFVSNVFRGVTNQDVEARECNDWLDVLGVIEVRFVSATGVYSVPDITNKTGIESGSLGTHVITSRGKIFQKTKLLVSTGGCAVLE